MLLDSNIIIYATEPRYENLRHFIVNQAPAVSAISKLEVLGYHKLQKQDEEWFQQFFDSAEILPVSEAVIDTAVILRRQKNMSLGDALIAGTALFFKRTLVTANVQDFIWIEDLRIINPIAENRSMP
jgi:hypothetical protein